MTSDDHQHGEAGGLPAHRLDHRDFSRMLVKVIDNVQQDPAQFRNLVYEMARVQLQREAWHRDPPMNILEIRRMMLSLERAIERVETDAALRDGIPALAPAEVVFPSDQTSAQDAVVVLEHSAARLRPAAVHRATNSAAPLRALLRLGIVVAVAAGAAITLDRDFHFLSPGPAVVATQQPLPALRAAINPISQQNTAPSPAPTGPMPTVYGVYALNGGHLYELDPMAGRAPDLRVFMSAVMKTPSHTVLPDGDLSFIVYRRDIASSAPDRVVVRVIAKIARALTFSKGGHPTTVNVDGEWAIRNVTFDYRVAPSSDSPEMIVVKPEAEAPPLAPGRYALVIKGQMFDFTVDGPITQAAHCLERTEAANGSFYSECRQVR
jgi:hypothetical protein